MNRAVAVVVALVVLAGSVPAAAALADTQTESEGPAPGASLAGVVGVQEAEIDNEVAERTLNQQFSAAESNASKARVVADQSQQLSERLDALEAEKERITQAHENGTMSRGEYQARLAALGAELQALEKRANRTAEAAESLPAESLRSNGANVSEVRTLAQQANRTSGDEVAEAARSIAGEDADEGLRGPSNASERGPADEVGERPDDTDNETERSSRPDNGNDAGQGDGQQNVTTGPPENETDRGNGEDAPGKNDSENGAPGNTSEVPDGNETAGQDSNATDTAGNESSREGGDDAATDQPDTTGAEAGNSTDGNTGDNDTAGDNDTTGGTNDDADGTDGAEPTTDGTETESA